MDDPNDPMQRTIHSEEAVAPSLNLTFISIHDLSAEARILYSSDSIVDVLGYTPDEVVNHSVWDFFSEEDMPLAKSIHKNGIEMDKAAMLVYCKVRDSRGNWVGCECCFTIVYDVMVVCTSVYSSGIPAQKRAQEAPLVRRMFASSPKDPRYHMLTHLSQKFKTTPKPTTHEPRAALFLNRFTRTLTIMYATTGIEEILGISSAELQGKSFYYCIEEQCLPDAVQCLENAKGNDSIAYLRFWYRNPLQPDSAESGAAYTSDSDAEMTTDASIDQALDRAQNYAEPQSRTSSGDSTAPQDSAAGIFGDSGPGESSESSRTRSPPAQSGPVRSGQIELEAVISCASDGLVVTLRRARPIMPSAIQRPTPSPPVSEHGIFAAPWADVPIMPSGYSRSATGSHASASSREPVSGPDSHDFMASIRDIGAFAWALTGINGRLHEYARGSPLGESTPANGMPIWAPDSPEADARSRSSVSTASAGYLSPTDSRMNVGNDHRAIFGDPGVKRRGGS